MPLLLADFGVTQAAEMLGVGMLAGVLGGLLGVGGGIIMIPAMVIFLGTAYGPNSFHVYKLAAISTSFVLSVPAIWRHRRAGAIVLRMIPGIVLGALVGVAIGVGMASTFVGEHTPSLRRLFGVFLELVVLINVYQEIQARRGRTHLVRSCPIPTRWTLLAPVVGLPAGIIAGLLGVGGGVWAVPSQRLLLGVRIRNAIANSACMILFVALGTACGLLIQLGSLSSETNLSTIGLWLAIWLAPGALIGGWIGAGLTHRLPVQWLRLIFAGLLVATGVRLIIA